MTPSQLEDPWHESSSRVVSGIFPKAQTLSARRRRDSSSVPHIGGVPAAELIRLLAAILIAFTTFASVQPVDTFPTHDVFERLTRQFPTRLSVFRFIY
jgi:hypothetical protein